MRNTNNKIKWLEQLGKTVDTRDGLNGTIVQINYETIDILTKEGHLKSIQKEDIEI